MKSMLGEVVIDFRRGEECGWMNGHGGGHVPVVEGMAFPRAPGFIPSPVDVLTAPGFWVDSLAPWPTRAEQERLENAQRRAMLEREARHFGLTPGRVVELLKAANAGLEYVKAWEEKA